MMRAPDLTRMRRSPTHPGHVLLAEVIEPRGYGAQAQAARTMGMSLNRLNEICSGKRSLTPESAILIGALTGTSADMWWKMQADYDLWHALQRVDASHIKAWPAPLTTE